VVSINAFTARIQADAKTIDPLKVLLFLLMAVPFLLGWTARIVWIVIALLLAACKDGWTQASSQIEARRGPVT
jgi:hypothetical protein